MENKKLGAACFVSGVVTILVTLLTWGHFGFWSSILFGVVAGAIMGFVSYKPLEVFKSGCVAIKAGFPSAKDVFVRKVSFVWNEIFGRPLLIVSLMISLAVGLQYTHVYLVDKPMTMSLVSVIVAGVFLFVIIWGAFCVGLVSMENDILGYVIHVPPESFFDRMSYRKGGKLAVIAFVGCVIVPFNILVECLQTIMEDFPKYITVITLGSIAATIVFLELTYTTKRIIATTHGPLGGLFMFGMLYVFHGADVLTLPIEMTLIAVMGAGVISVVIGLASDKLIHNSVLPRLNRLLANIDLVG